MAQSRPVPNADLVALGPKLDQAGRDELDQLGLIESDRSSGRFVHELTDEGWHLCHDILTAGAPPRSTGPAKTLYAVLGALDRHLDGADLSLAAVFRYPADVQTTATIEDRVRDVYARLAPRPGGSVSLAHVRAELADARAPTSTPPCTPSTAPTA